MKKFLSFLIVSTLTLIMGIAGSPAGVITSELESILQSSGAEDGIPVIISLSDKVDLRQFNQHRRGPQNPEMIRALRLKALLTQRPFVSILRKQEAKNIVSLWINNSIAVRARASVIRKLAVYKEIGSIKPDSVLNAPVVSVSSAAVPEWNLDVIRAPELWDLGYTGYGIVVASMDTGVDLYHQDLKDRWRGGSNSWFDPHGEHLLPYDAHGHGTQTMGIMAGGSADGSAIGAAPDAQWIAVKIYDDSGVTALSTIHQGFQWLLDPDGSPDTNDMPDVVNNSWGFTDNPDECITEFKYDIKALKAAGIAVVFSGGNAGPYYSTSISPANNTNGFAVGAIDEYYKVSDFSSRGPSACDQTVYPEVTAPGVNIRTSDLTIGGIYPDTYVNVTGTSYAAAHVSGMMALLISAFPETSVPELENALMVSALDLGGTGADNDFGYGLADSVEAYNLLAEPSLCTDADTDGYYYEAGCGTVQDCDDHDASVYPGADEVKHDEIDQDCNGYDLTIDITKLNYNSKKDSLTVEATSALGDTADLELTGYGPMQWQNKKKRWSITVRPAGGDPGTITVTGIEGSETASTTGSGTDEGGNNGKEGNGKTCSDGIDNDDDGFIDCTDPDCEKNRACR